MILLQACICALVGTGIGLGFCGVVGELMTLIDFPFRLMWYGPLLGTAGVLIVALSAAMISIRPVLKLAPGVVFMGRL